jgi:hypothetical protein
MRVYKNLKLDDILDQSVDYLDSLGIKGNFLSVLRRLVSYGNDEGESIFPSHTEVAHYAKCSLKTVERAVKLSKSQNILFIEKLPTKGRATVYSLNVELLIKNFKKPELSVARHFDEKEISSHDNLSTDRLLSSDNLSESHDNLSLSSDNLGTPINNNNHITNNIYSASPSASLNDSFENSLLEETAKQPLVATAPSFSAKGSIQESLLTIYQQMVALMEQATKLLALSVQETPIQPQSLYRNSDRPVMQIPITEQNCNAHGISHFENTDSKQALSLTDKATKKPKISASERSAQFNEWYSAYPLRKDPQAAIKAFEKALKLTSFEMLLVGAKAYGLWITANKKEDFIKYPATWLNKGCWEDEDLKPFLNLSTPPTTSKALQTKESIDPRILGAFSFNQERIIAAIQSAPLRVIETPEKVTIQSGSRIARGEMQSEIRILENNFGKPVSIEELRTPSNHKIPTHDQDPTEHYKPLDAIEPHNNKNEREESRSREKLCGRKASNFGIPSPSRKPKTIGMVLEKITEFPPENLQFSFGGGRSCNVNCVNKKRSRAKTNVF